MATQFNDTLSKLGDLSIDDFLEDYWQKKPLLIKNAISNFKSPLEADELGGLAMEEESQSRLVIKKHDEWQLIHGPLQESIFAELPQSCWTLLVQNADSLDPAINALLSNFRFIPNWRLDDIMVSYSVDRGGVGPHFDYYDVFLLQAEGKKRWRIGQTCDQNSELQPNQPMKILTDFKCRYDWEVEAGDLIYIPAKIAHWGESIGESITYSIGFRSPSYSELLLDSTQHFNAELTEDERYVDGGEIKSRLHPGLIPKEAIQRLQQQLLKLVDDEDTLAHWLAETSTNLKPGVIPESLPLNFANEEDCYLGKAVRLSAFCRAAHIEIEPEPACYINGQSYSMSLSLAEQLSGYQNIYPQQLNKAELETLIQLCGYSLIVLVEQTE